MPLPILVAFPGGLPPGFGDAIYNHGSEGVQTFAFRPTGDWVLVTKAAIYQSANMPAGFISQLQAYLSAGEQIRSIAFPSYASDAWVILTATTYAAHDIPDDCYQQIGSFYNGGFDTTCVAFAPGGGWTLLAGNAFWGINIPSDSYQFLSNYCQSSRPATQIAFTPSGGWVMIADEYTRSGNGAPAGCVDQFAQFVAQGFWPDHIAFTPDGGWVLSSNTLVQARAADPIRAIESAVAGTTIWQRMSDLGIVGAGVAVVIDNRVDWVCSYGQRSMGGEYVNNDCLFQGASLSKPFTALGVLTLHGQGHLDLDANISNLINWTIPLDAAVAPAPRAAWRNEMTARLLARHRGGVSLNDGGFGGFDYPMIGALPTTLEMLNGGSTRPLVRVETGAVLSYEPNGLRALTYSGRGYLVLMRLIEQVTGTDFATWMKNNVFTPMGFNDTQYAAVVPGGTLHATQYDGSGALQQGGFPVMPELPAAGVWTTARDLARLVALLNAGGVIDGVRQLDATLAQTMRETEFGMFTSGAATTDAGYFYWHNGIHPGRQAFRGYPNKNVGVAVMCNSDSDNGGTFWQDVIDAVVAQYGW